MFAPPRKDETSGADIGALYRLGSANVVLASLDVVEGDRVSPKDCCLFLPVSFSRKDIAGGQKVPRQQIDALRCYMITVMSDGVFVEDNDTVVMALAPCRSRKIS